MIAITNFDRTNRTDRTLIAKTTFQPGDVVFRERSIWHSAHTLGHGFRPCSNITSIAPDYQRLMYIACHLLQKEDPSSACHLLQKEDCSSKTTPDSSLFTGESISDDIKASLVSEMVDHLSTDGVTSALACGINGSRTLDDRLSLESFRKYLIKTEGKKPSSKRLKRTPNLDTLERILCIVETNCHSREWPIDNMPDTVDDEEEWIGVWFVGSMMDHACQPNATVHLSIVDEEAELVVRAIHDISPNDPITISYIDEEFVPTEVRLDHLTPRGFACHCSMCHVDDPERTVPVYTWDYCRAQYCLLCPGFVRIVADKETPWTCDRCASVYSNFHRVQAQKELSELESDAERLLQLCQYLFQSLDAYLQSNAPIQLQDVDSINHMVVHVADYMRTQRQLEMMHPTDTTIYTFIRSNLYENSQSFLMQFSTFRYHHAAILAGLWLVACNVRLTDHLRTSKGLFYCEDLRHNLFWLAYSIQQLGGDDRFRLLFRGAVESCLAQCLVLYGEGALETVQCQQLLE
jgi:hypothetical protein